MSQDLIEVGVVGPVLLRSAVVSLIACHPEFRVSDPSDAVVRVEVGADFEIAPGIRESSRFILVRPERPADGALPVGAYIGFDESVSSLREAIFVMAGSSHRAANAA